MKVHRRGRGTPDRKGHATNDRVLAFVAKHQDIALAFVSLDPTRGREAVADARRLIAQGGVRGLKLHPPLQQFFPNDRIAYARASRRRVCPSSSTPATPAILIGPAP